MPDDRFERLFEENTAAMRELRVAIVDMGERQERALGLLAQHLDRALDRLGTKIDRLDAKLDRLDAKLDRLGLAIESLSVDVRDLRRTWRGGNGPSPEPA